MELAGKKLGIIGMGRIGQSLKRAQAFGMKIYYNRRKLASSIEQLTQATFVDDLDTLLSNSDVVSLVSLTRKYTPSNQRSASKPNAITYHSAEYF